MSEAKGSVVKTSQDLYDFGHASLSEHSILTAEERLQVEQDVNSIKEDYERAKSFLDTTSILDRMDSYSREQSTMAKPKRKSRKSISVCFPVGFFWKNPLFAGMTVSEMIKYFNNQP